MARLQARGTEKGPERAELPKFAASEGARRVTILLKSVRFRRRHELKFIRASRHS